MFSSPAWAARKFPAKVKRGQMTFVAIPNVLIDGQPVRLDHSVRVYSVRNTLLLPQQLNGKTAVVNYLHSGPGKKIHEVWILTAAEAAVPLPGTPTVNFNINPTPSADTTKPAAAAPGTATAPVTKPALAASSPN